ncbi:MAG: DUF4981 domain-containing protein [Clostridia bacterium]|nr:DUF4981 domain-containing protein [Clostridia bacterium]
MDHIWENPAIQHENRLAPRAAFTYYDTEAKALARNEDESACRLLLNGEWLFKLVDSPLKVDPACFGEDCVPDSAWGTISVPGCWQMQGYGGKPVYSGAPYLFPVEPPYVATDNDTGLYRREFTLPKAMEGRRVVIRFEGVGCMFFVYVNGQKIGMSKGSHMTAEFDITDAVRPGRNLLGVEVLRFCDGSYLEIQDMYHMSGIFRSVSLLATPKTDYIEDIYLRADSTGCLKAEVSGTSVHARLYDGDTVVAAASGTSFEMRVENARLWSAEDPYLYTLIVEANGVFVPVRVGFRTVERRGPELLVNGRPIKAKGVNHHDTNTDTGWAVGREALLQDVLLMKRHNVNFIRTSHYPSDSYLYDLADEYGLYVLDEADIECHGMTAVSWSMLSKSPEWTRAYVDRTERMIYRDRNHPCVVAWSLGNESGFGDNHRAAAKAARAIDNRLIHYEAAREMPDFNMEEVMKDPTKMYAMREAREKTPWDPCVDFESVMYPPLDLLERHARREDDRPFFVCEYAHSMGNSPGTLKEYWELIYRYPKLLGGCIWEWQDHGLRAYTDKGEMYWAGGCDYGMPFELRGANGNFCNDGLIASDKTPHPAMTELKKAYQPLYFELVSQDPVTVKVISHYQFLSDECAGKWRLVKDGMTLSEGAICIDDQAPGTERDYVLPVEVPAGECFLNISFTLKRAAKWAEAGFEVASEQFVLNEGLSAAPACACAPLKGCAAACEYTVVGEDFSLKFDLLHDELTQWIQGGRSCLTTPVRQNFWHAPTDNDTGFGNGATSKWLGRGIDRLVPRNTAEPEIVEEPGRISLTFRQRWGANPNAVCLDTVQTYTVFGDGKIDVKVSYRELPDPKTSAPFWWPRLGVTMGLAKEMKRISWHGRGPGENYVDRCWASDIGWYSADVGDMHTSYARMQENGARTDVRYMAAADLRGAGVKFTALSAPFTFTAHDYTDAALTKAWHEYQLERAGCTVIDIDLAQTGLGSSSCGPEALDKYKLFLKDRELSYSFRMEYINR